MTDTSHVQESSKINMKSQAVGFSRPQPDLGAWLSGDTCRACKEEAKDGAGCCDTLPAEV